MVILARMEVPEGAAPMGRRNSVSLQLSPRALTVWRAEISSMASYAPPSRWSAHWTLPPICRTQALAERQGVLEHRAPVTVPLVPAAGVHTAE